MNQNSLIKVAEPSCLSFMCGPKKRTTPFPPEGSGLLLVADVGVLNDWARKLQDKSPKPTPESPLPLNPKPLHPKPETLNPKPQTLEVAAKSHRTQGSAHHQQQPLRFGITGFPNWDAG